MNAPEPPPLPGSATAHSADHDPLLVHVHTEARVLTALGAVIGITVLGDFLSWHVWPGIGWGVFAVALGALLVAHGARSIIGWGAFGLLAASAAQMVVEPCFTGFVVMGILLIALFAESTYRLMPAGWARWSEALWGLARGPGRWFNFGAAVIRSRAFVTGVNRVDGDRIVLLARIVMPSLALATIFGIVLSLGNAVLAEFFSRALTQLGHWLAEFDCSFGRMVFWLVCATLGVTVFWPAPAPAQPRWWTRPIRRWQRNERTVAIWQSALVLVTLNALFFAANTIDAFYLWHRTALPLGVTASQFVHQGVQSLIGAVLLAGLALTIIFQQDAEVVGARVLKGLALAWIAQNLMLIGSVVLRLDLYVVAFQLSELRVYVGCFLLLVATGFALLAWQVVKGMNLGRLCLANARATFVLFFVLQFPDVGQAVARYNVAQWQREPQARTLDVEYLQSLGPSGWEALRTVRATGLQPAAPQAEQILRQEASKAHARLFWQNWREWQARRDRRAAQLIAEVAQWPPEPAK